MRKQKAGSKARTSSSRKTAALPPRDIDEKQARQHSDIDALDLAPDHLGGVKEGGWKVRLRRYATSLRASEKTVESIDKTFHDAFADMIKDGKADWDAFGKALATSFKTAVADEIYKLTIKPSLSAWSAALLAAQRKRPVQQQANPAAVSAGGAGRAGGVWRLQQRHQQCRGICTSGVGNGFAQSAAGAISRATNCRKRWGPQAERR